MLIFAGKAVETFQLLDPMLSASESHWTHPGALSQFGSEPMMAFRPLSSWRKEYSCHGTLFTSPPTWPAWANMGIDIWFSWRWFWHLTKTRLHELDLKGRTHQRPCIRPTSQGAISETLMINHYLLSSSPLHNITTQKVQHPMQKPQSPGIRMLPSGMPIASLSVGVVVAVVAVVPPQPPSLASPSPS